MPDIIVSLPFADGSPASADALSEELYEPLNPPGNMEVINGRLDDDNLVAGDVLDRRDVRSGAFTTLKSTGATASVDYFFNFFNFANFTTPPMSAGPAADVTGSALIPLHMPIPGAAQSFYLRYPSLVFLSWDVQLETSSSAPAAPDTSELPNSISLRLFVDGGVVDGVSSLTNQRRQLNIGSGTGTGAARRHFSGHCVLSPTDFPSFTTKGWHTASIRIAHQQYQVRVTTRRFNVIALRA